jgi:transglutaminase-like putative cysteine protease
VNAAPAAAAQPLRLRIETELDYTFSAPTAVLLQIEAAILPDQAVEVAQILLGPTAHFKRIPGHDSIGERIWLDLEGQLTVSYSATLAIQRESAELETLAATAPHLIPGEAVDYLMPSRYCQVDHFENFVTGEFAGLSGGAAIAAMRDWIAVHFSYVPGVSTSATGALESFVLRKGICRDYAHMLITFARAAGIPARFASGYAPAVTPQDFHAVAEVFLAGAWHIVDATGMASAADIATIGVGRDAADTSFLTYYSHGAMVRQEVSVSRL